MEIRGKTFRHYTEDRTRYLDITPIYYGNISEPCKVLINQCNELDDVTKRNACVLDILRSGAFVRYNVSKLKNA